MTTDDTPEPVRLDVWLDVACLFKTRSQAQKACKGGKVEVNGARGKPGRTVEPGDELRISRRGWKQLVVVRDLADRHIPKAEARELYEDVTPEPTPEERKIRELARQAGLRHPGAGGAPDKRERRRLRRLKRGKRGDD